MNLIQLYQGVSILCKYCRVLYHLIKLFHTCSSALLVLSLADMLVLVVRVLLCSPYIMYLIFPPKFDNAVSLSEAVLMPFWLTCIAHGSQSLPHATITG